MRGEGLGLAVRGEGCGVSREGGVRWEGGLSTPRHAKSSMSTHRCLHGEGKGHDVTARWVTHNEPEQATGGGNTHFLHLRP